MKTNGQAKNGAETAAVEDCVLVVDGNELKANSIMSRKADAATHSLASGSTNMNWDQIEVNWLTVCENIKRTWGKLSEDDLTAIAGQRDRLAGLLRERYGYEKVVAENKVDEFAQGLRP